MSIHPKTGKNSNTKANVVSKGAGEKKQQIDPTHSRRRESIKIRAELNERETRRNVERMNESRSWFFERINNIDKSLGSLIKKKRERTQINKIMNDQ